MKRTAFALILATLAPIVAPASAETITLMREITAADRAKYGFDRDNDDRRPPLWWDHPGNYAEVRQDGTGHSAGVSQSGTDNGVRLLQYGNGASANVVQSGGKKVIILQISR